MAEEEQTHEITHESRNSINAVELAEPVKSYEEVMSPRRIMKEAVTSKS